MHLVLEEELIGGGHDPNLYEGTKRFFKPNYVANIVNSWISPLDGRNVEEKLKRGDAIVADVECGHGISTILMAKVYPNSKFIGFDNYGNRIISNSKDSLYNLLIYNQPQYGKK